jgi:hypothetical protein
VKLNQAFDFEVAEDESDEVCEFSAELPPLRLVPSIEELGFDSSGTTT